MQYFDHIDARTTEEAVHLLRRYKGKAKVIAGGTDLIGILKNQILPKYPEVVINLKTIRGLDYIIERKNALKIGSLTALQNIADSQTVRKNYKVLAEAVNAVATPEIRNMGTIGGNLAQDVRCWYYRYPRLIGGPIICRRKDKHSPCIAKIGDNRYHAVMEIKECIAVCPSDIAVALSALNAKMKIVGPDGIRVIPVAEFYKSLGQDLNKDEIITEVQIPKIEDSSKQIFLKYTLRQPIDFAIVSVAAVFDIKQNVIRRTSIYLGAMAYRPFRAREAEMILVGQAVSESIAVKAANMQFINAIPLDKNAYKVEIAGSQLKRAIISCA
jgi:xanthine dehydrogenase YagS FAD-binding subunit